MTKSAPPSSLLSFAKSLHWQYVPMAQCVDSTAASSTEDDFLPECGTAGATHVLSWADFMKVFATSLQRSLDLLVNLLITYLC